MSRKLVSLLLGLAIMMILGVAAPPRAAAQATSDEEATIKDVITRFNKASEQATENQDMSVERDLTTDDFYREMSQDMQAGWEAGIVSAVMLKLEWGAINVDGDTATAVTFETWALALDDGRTGQFPPERNIYTLVRDNGVWKVQSDEHPDTNQQQDPNLPMTRFTPGLDRAVSR